VNLAKRKTQNRVWFTFASLKPRFVSLHCVLMKAKDTTHFFYISNGGKDLKYNEMVKERSVCTHFVYNLALFRSVGKEKGRSVLPLPSPFPFLHTTTFLI